MWNRTPALALSGLASVHACGGEATPLDPAGSSSSSSSTTAAPDSTGASDDAGDDSTQSTAGDVPGSGGDDTGGARDCEDLDLFVATLTAADPGDRVALTDAFVAAAQYSEHGLPLRCEGRLVAFAWQDTADAV
ncbi:MAG: hypothetical protein IAG13_30945, partial [Deltaproteobacteria bacterium]|nr:hypothetical protein [Nannocystaceae bacterium]